MARKNARIAEGEAFLFDTRTKAVMAKATTNDGIKDKLKQVQEVVTGHTKDDIYIALEYYELDVERTIQAFLENGAKEVLEQWKFSGSRPSSKKKKKNKPAASAQQSNSKEPPAVAAASNNVPTPTSIALSAPSQDRLAAGGVEAAAAEPPSHANISSSSPLSAPKEPSPSSSDQPPASDASSKSNRGVKEKRAMTTPLNIDTAGPMKQVQRPKALEDYKKRDKGAKPRERTLSETSSLSSSFRGKGPHAGLEKSLKDLNRQITSLTRLKTVLKERCEQSNKDITKMFLKLQGLLSDREVSLMYELQKVKDHSSDVLSQRQKTASELKRRADRAPSMKDHELSELRADIKHFVSERKIDEDLSSTQRFVCDEAAFIEAINNYGKVIPPRTNYSQRRLSTTSSVSSDLLSPMTPLTPMTPHTPASASVFSPPPLPSTPAAIIPNLSGAKVLSQSDSLTKYEILNKDKLADTKPKSSGPVRNSYNRGSGGPPQGRGKPNQQQQRPPQQQLQQQEESSPELGDEDARKSRSARRRLRQREKQREMKRTQQQSGDSSKASSSGDSPAKPRNNPDKTENPQQQQTADDRGYNKPRRTPSPRKNYGGGDSYQRQGQGQGQDRRRSPEKGRPRSPDKKPQQILAKNAAVNHDTQAEQQSTDTPVQKAPSDNEPAQKSVVDSKVVQNSGDTKMNGDINEAMPADENALPQRKPRNRGDRKVPAESIVNGEAEHFVNGVVNGVNGL